jgi:cytosine/adenosine deaminase-related metal-dependent hydrolase
MNCRRFTRNHNAGRRHWSADQYPLGPTISPISRKRFLQSLAAAALVGVLPAAARAVIPGAAGAAEPAPELMGDRIGSLEPGKAADLLVIDMQRAALAPTQTLVSNLVYANDRHAVRDAYVSGRAIVLEGEHQLLDRERVVTRARAALQRVLARAELGDYLRERGQWQWHRQGGR